MVFHEMQALFGMAGGVLGFIDYLIYARSVLLGRTKPNAATWIGTSVVWFAALVSYFLVGARDTLWFVIASAAGSFIVALLTVRYGVKWQRSDFACLTGAAGVGALGFLTESPLTTLCAAMAVDFLALFRHVCRADVFALIRVVHAVGDIEIPAGNQMVMKFLRILHILHTKKHEAQNNGQR